jgi:hypothetical protein
MMSGDELNDDFCNVRRHRHGVDKVAAGVSECRCFGRISRDRTNLVPLIRRIRAQGYP